MASENERMDTNDRTLRVACYARYSDDKQNPTSLEDQVRRCRDLARQHGLALDAHLVFTDSAISGQADSEARREGYQRMKQAWDTRQFDVLLVDEFSRLSRAAVEQAYLMERLSRSRRVRLLTADGVDTWQSDWKLRLGIHGVLAQHESDKIRFRVKRGMEGQLERGYQVAAAPYGYTARPEFDGVRRVGTHWEINETQAGIVRQIFAMREAGQSMHQIATWLNRERVPCSATVRRKAAGYWRPARVKTLLKNPIYRGIFVWHGSDSYQAEMERRGETVSVVEYPRPALRIVSDETWTRCNSRSISRSGYGGGTHALSGLVSCGCCSGTLVLSSRRHRSRSLYCAACTVASHVDGQRRLTSTVLADGVQVMLVEALRYFLTPSFVAAFRASLTQVLAGDNSRAIAACETKLGELRETQRRLARMLGQRGNVDPVLEEQYDEVARQAEDEARELARLKAGRAQVDVRAVEAQNRVDPAALLAGIFGRDLPAEQLRATLTRLFPKIVFEGKEYRDGCRVAMTSYFRVHFAAGAALAMASATEAVISEEFECRFRLRYVPSHRKGSGDGPRWRVERADELPASGDTVPEGMDACCEV